jgi:hypothetical protein
MSLELHIEILRTIIYNKLQTSIYKLLATWGSVHYIYCSVCLSIF